MIDYCKCAPTAPTSGSATADRHRDHRAGGRRRRGPNRRRQPAPAKRGLLLSLTAVVLAACTSTAPSSVTATAPTTSADESAVASTPTPPTGAVSPPQGSLTSRRPAARTSHDDTAATSSSSAAARAAGPKPAVGPLRSVLESWRLPEPLSRTVVFTADRTLLLAGVLTPAGSTAAMVSVDPAGGSTKPAGDLAVAVHDAAGLTLGGRRFVLGGGTGPSVAAVQQLAGAAAAIRAALPRPRSDLVTADVGQIGYVLGGYDGSTLDSAVWSTTDGQHFLTVARLPTPVRYPAVAVLNTEIYLFGGEHAGRPTSAIQRIDTRTGTATLIGHLPQALAHAATVTLHGAIYLLGGRTATTAIDNILRFDPARAAMLPAGHLPYAVSDAAAAVVHGIGYLLGGENPRLLATVVELREG